MFIPLAQTTGEKVGLLQSVMTAHGHGLIDEGVQYLCYNPRMASFIKIPLSLLHELPYQ